MNDKSLEYLKCYDLQIRKMVKGRGGVIVSTSKGNVLFLECTRNDGFYIRDEAVTNAIIEAGFKNVDTYIRNADGELFTQGDDGRRYVVKRWFAGRECDVKSEEDVIEAVRALADLHKCLNVVAAREVYVIEKQLSNSGNTGWESMAQAEKQEACDGLVLRASESQVERIVHFDKGNGIRQNMDRHTKELKKAANYMRGKKKKNEFEQIALGCMDMFYKEAQEALANIMNDRFDDRFKRMEDTGELIHGSFNYHNVFLGADGGSAVTNFERCHNNCQIIDLYQFLRKVLEKHNWDAGVAYRIVDEYDKLKPVEDDDLDMLMILMGFPEKFWKIINQYYNAGKAWIPTKNIDKLKLVIKQNDSRRELIDKMCGV